MKSEIVRFRTTKEEKAKILKAFGTYANLRDYALRIIDEQKVGHVDRLFIQDLKDQAENNIYEKTK